MYLLFDIGGTNLRMAISRTGRRVDDCVIVNKPSDFKKGVLAIKTIADELSGGKKYKAVCCGIAGMLDPKKTKLVYSPHIKGWVGKPLKKELEKALNAKVFLENDADLGGLGEATYGSGKDKKIVAYIAIGTGIGGTRIVNKKIDANSIGFEPGHIIICAGKKSYLPPYYLGEWEGLVSGTALEKRYGMKSKLIKKKAAWDYAIKYLVYGLHDVVRLWSPELIVLGGGLMDNPNMKVSKIASQL
ncbi:ROK family protein, partial [Patescibacteria group bacterium]|nr:ROK family protein [Patescibacteria group bacterium]MBU1890543.1 ROK family protein [Patescibacteria group bacterium]